MIRLLAIAVAAALFAYPLFLIYSMTVPVERFRTGTYTDLLTFAGTVVAVYGGVLSGVAVQWVRGGRRLQNVRPGKVFKAGVWGAVAVATVVVVGSGVQCLATQGSFEKGIGNLWGLVLIFAALFGSFVSAGVALLLYGLRPLAGGGESR